MPATPAPPPTAATQWFSAFLEAVLAKAAAVLGASAPARRYVSPGPPAPDCGQLVVYCDRLRATQRPTQSQGNPMGTKEIVSVADVCVVLQKCVTSLTPEGGIPTAAVIDADGKEFADEGWAMWFGLIGATLDGSLFPTQQRPPVLWRDQVQQIPQAGLATWRATLEVTLA